jgi:hypothetical protein
VDELSRIGRKLIDEAMERDEPPPTDESWGTLVSRLTAEAPREVSSETPSPEAIDRPRRGTRGIAIAAVVVLAAIAAWWWWSRPEAKPVAQEPTRAEAPAIVAEPPAVTRPDRDAPDEPPVEPLIAEAEAALAAGDPDRALALLQRHAERAPVHPQAQQRMALRVLVLCAQGEDEQARAEARAFLAAHADSQFAADVRRSCAAP